MCTEKKRKEREREREKRLRFRCPKIHSDLHVLTLIFAWSCTIKRGAKLHNYPWNHWINGTGTWKSCTIKRGAQISVALISVEHCTTNRRQTCTQCVQYILWQLPFCIPLLVVGLKKHFYVDAKKKSGKHFFPQNLKLFFFLFFLFAYLKRDFRSKKTSLLLVPYSFASGKRKFLNRSILKEVWFGPCTCFTPTWGVHYLDLWVHML